VENRAEDGGEKLVQTYHGPELVGSKGENGDPMGERRITPGRKLQGYDEGLS